MGRGWTIDWTEFVGDGGPRESFQMNTSQVTRHIDVNWSDRIQATYEALGYATYSGSGYKLTRWIPEVYPEAEFLVATGIPTVTGYGIPADRNLKNMDFARGPVARWRRARLEVVYTHVPYQVKTDDEITREYERYTSVNYKFAAQFFQYPTATFKFAGTSIPIPTNGGVNISTMDVQYTWHDVPDANLPMQTIAAYFGTVNQEDFQIGYDFWPQHTMLFLGVDPIRKFTPYGTIVWDMVYLFKFFEQTHNKVFDYTDGTWKKASRDGSSWTAGTLTDGLALYNERDHRELWKPATP